MVKCFSLDGVHSATRALEPTIPRGKRLPVPECVGELPGSSTPQADLSLGCGLRDEPSGGPISRSTRVDQMGGSSRAEMTPS